MPRKLTLKRPETGVVPVVPEPPERTLSERRAHAFERFLQLRLTSIPIRDLTDGYLDEVLS